MLRSLSILLVSLALQTSAAPPNSVGQALSEYPFVIEGVEIPGSGTLLEGEVVSAGYLPVRLLLSNGAFVILGAGSRARIAANRIWLDGVSLEVLRSGSPPLTVEAHRFEFVPAEQEARFVLYTDNEQAVSLSTLAGTVTPAVVGGEAQPEMLAGQQATFSEELGEVRAQPFRAPLEIARIQLRQLDLIGEAAVTLPPLRRKLTRLAETISEASSGLVSPQAALFGVKEQIAREAPTGSAAVDPEQLMRAVHVVRTQLHRPGLRWTGCGEPSCKGMDPPDRPASFRGWPRSLPPLPGCALCRSGETDFPLVP